MIVQIRGLTRHYGRDAVLADVDLDVADGEFLALLGPSGAGKTTLLRLIAGLDRPDAGEVLIDGRDVLCVSPRERRIGFVFQNYALFRHMSVARNIAFGLSVKPRRKRPSRAEIAARVEELLDLMQLSGLGDRFPAQLSGGQRQRAALARALAIDPKVLLLDEPFGALDAKVRVELREWLYELQRRLRLTTIFVTHDQGEAFQLANRTAILNAGRIEQIDEPEAIRAHPASPFVAEFLGARRRTKSEPLWPAAVESREPAPTVLPQHCNRSSAIAGGVLVFERGTAATMPEPAAPTVATLPPIQQQLSISAGRSTRPPAVEPAQLWFVELPAVQEAMSALERHVVVSANVVIYDRSLTDVVAAILPPGGYAESVATGDGIERCLQFARDGWSVARLIDGDHRGPDVIEQLRALARRLGAAGAPADLRLAKWLFRAEGHLSTEATLGQIESLIQDHPPSERWIAVFGAFGALATFSHTVSGNGLAG